MNDDSRRDVRGSTSHFKVLTTHLPQRTKEINENQIRIASPS